MAHVHMHREDLEVIIRMLDKGVLSIRADAETTGLPVSDALTEELEHAESVATTLAHVARGRKIVEVEFGHYDDDDETDVPVLAKPRYE